MCDIRDDAFGLNVAILVLIQLHSRIICKTWVGLIMRMVKVNTTGLVNEIDEPHIITTLSNFSFLLSPHLKVQLACLLFLQLEEI